jgi:hypothetical protein
MLSRAGAGRTIDEEWLQDVDTGPRASGHDLLLSRCLTEQYTDLCSSVVLAMSDGPGRCFT